MLRELGWDTEDPDKVRPEYQDSGGSADYALMREGTPVALVKAKKLGASLVSGIEQVLNYCNQQGINYMVATDGDHWEMYEVFRPARIQDRKLTSITVTGESAYQGALKALYLWHPNLGSGVAVVVPPKPAIADEPTELRQTTPVEGAPVPQSAVYPPSSPQRASSWIPITEVEPESGDKAPSAVRFPDGEQNGIKYWREILVQVAEWLARNGILTPEKCPIGKGYERYIVHSQSRHPSGRDFFAPQQLSAGLFVETDVGSWYAVKDALFLIEKLNQTATSFQLLLA